MNPQSSLSLTAFIQLITPSFKHFLHVDSRKAHFLYPSYLSSSPSQSLLQSLPLNGGVNLGSVMEPVLSLCWTPLLSSNMCYPSGKERMTPKAEAEMKKAEAEGRATGRWGRKAEHQAIQGSPPAWKPNGIGPTGSQTCLAPVTLYFLHILLPWAECLLYVCLPLYLESI